MIIIPTNPDVNAVPEEQKEALHPQRSLSEGAVIGQAGAADPQPVLPASGLILSCRGQQELCLQLHKAAALGTD